MSDARCLVCGREKANPYMNPVPAERCYMALGDELPGWTPTPTQEAEHWRLGYERLLRLREGK